MISPSQRPLPDNTQHSQQTNIDVPCGIRTHNPCRRALDRMTTGIGRHKAVMKPIWSYETELWGCASKSNTVIMLRSQSKILRATTNAPRYVTNHTLHTDFNVPYVSDVIHEIINKHHNKPEAHPNPLLQQPLQPVNSSRLNRCWPLDLQGT